MEGRSQNNWKGHLEVALEQMEAAEEEQDALDIGEAFEAPKGVTPQQVLNHAQALYPRTLDSVSTPLEEEDNGIAELMANIANTIFARNP